MKRRSAGVAVLVSLIVGLGALPAFAGTPGTWQKIGSDVGSSLWEPTAARTGDGYLHVLWGTETNTLAEIYQHVRISPSGSVGKANQAIKWGDGLTSDPKVLPDGSGLQTFFSGFHSTTTSDPLSTGAYFRITAGSSGATWSAPVQSGQWTSAYGNYGTGATLLADGTPVVAGELNSDVYWHVGTNAADPDGHFNISGASILNLSLATDAKTDEVWAAWYDLSKGGVWVRRILPSLTTPVRAPGSVTKTGDSLSPYQSIAMAAPSSGGVYVAYCVGYPSCTSAQVWKIGAKGTLTIPGTKNVRMIDLSVGPVGRIWAAYMSGNDYHLYAARSNKSVTKFGTLGDLGRPKGAYGYKLDIEGSLGRGDVIINAQSTTGVFNIWHTQVLPGLALSASPTKWSGSSAKTVDFTVRDAGQAVSGATVKVGTKSCKTGSAGSCSIKFPKMKAQKLTATASKSGYRKDALTLTVT
ncbi:MAG: hypothetical protein ACXVWF_04885 [Actinomycetota bacterium]